MNRKFRKFQNEIFFNYGISWLSSLEKTCYNIPRIKWSGDLGCNIMKSYWKDAAFRDDIVKSLIVEAVIGGASPVVGVLFNCELPRPIFSIIFLVWMLASIKLLAAFISNVIKEKRRNDRRLNSRLDKLGDLENPRKYDSKKAEFKKYYRRKYRVFFWKNFASVIIVVVAGGFLCVCNPENAYGLWAGFVGLTVDQKSYLEPDIEAADSMISEEPVAESEGGSITQKEDIVTVNEEREFIAKPNGAHFVLENPRWAPIIDEETESAVFFMGCPSDQSLEEYIVIYMEEIRSYQYEGVPLSELKDETVGKTYYDYTSEEDRFKLMVERYQTEQDLMIWREKAPKSSSFMSYLNGRERLRQVTLDGRAGNSEVSWKLANDYQYLALEYDAQTENGSAVLYCYVMSIYYAIDAMKYRETYDKQYDDTICHYITMRYKDIADTELNIPMLYKSLAKRIYECLSVADEQFEGGMVE